MTLTPDTLFASRYRLLKQIGLGGFSVVWLSADELADNFECAIKIYAPERGLDDAGLRQFRKEYTVTANLQHLGLLKATYFDVHVGSPFLVMPFCKNGSLAGMLQEKGTFTEREIAEVLLQITDALAYLHEEEILHQDIKPDNVLISDKEKYLLTDFGISSRMRSTLRKSTTTQKALTLAYAPPERFNASQESLPAGDVFSLGVMLFELATGDVPWMGAGGSVLKADTELPKLPGTFSKELTTLMQRCMAYDPIKRPTARELSAAALAIGGIQALDDGGSTDAFQRAKQMSSEADELKMERVTERVSNKQPHETKVISDTKIPKHLSSLKIPIIDYSDCSFLPTDFNEENLILDLGGNETIVGYIVNGTIMILYRKSNQGVDWTTTHYIQQRLIDIHFHFRSKGQYVRYIHTCSIPLIQNIEYIKLFEAVDRHINIFYHSKINRAICLAMAFHYKNLELHSKLLIHYNFNGHNYFSAIEIDDGICDNTHFFVSGKYVDHDIALKGALAQFNMKPNDFDNLITLSEAKLEGFRENTIFANDLWALEGLAVASLVKRGEILMLKLSLLEFRILFSVDEREPFLIIDTETVPFRRESAIYVNMDSLGSFKVNIHLDFPGFPSAKELVHAFQFQASTTSSIGSPKLLVDVNADSIGYIHVEIEEVNYNQGEKLKFRIPFKN